MLANSGFRKLPSGLWAPINSGDGVPLSPTVCAARSVKGTLANDSILVTPGSGATVATHAQGSKEHDVVMLARASGHLIGTENWYFYNTGPSVLVAAASTLFFDMFNADAALIVRVQGIWLAQLIEGAVTGVGVRWQALRTTAVGTGGTTLTAWLADTGDTALDADITGRLKATGGATAGSSLFWGNTNSEEVQGWGHDIWVMNILPDVLVWSGKGIVLRQNQGIRINQESNTAVGNMSMLVGFTVE